MNIPNGIVPAGLHTPALLDTSPLRPTSDLPSFSVSNDVLLLVISVSDDVPSLAVSAIYLAKYVK